MSEKPIDPAIQAMMDALKEARMVARFGDSEEEEYEPPMSKRPFSLSVLASTALALRSGCENDYEAALRALKFLDSCADTLDGRKQEIEYEQEQARSLAELKLHPEHRCTFAEGIKLITGQARLARQKADFLAFLQERAARRWNNSCDVAEGLYDSYEENGFSNEKVVEFKADFERYRDEKGRSSKKALTQPSANAAEKPAKKPRKRATKWDNTATKRQKPAKKA